MHTGDFQYNLKGVLAEFGGFSRALQRFLVMFTSPKIFSEVQQRFITWRRRKGMLPALQNVEMFPSLQKFVCALHRKCKILQQTIFRVLLMWFWHKLFLKHCVMLWVRAGCQVLLREYLNLWDCLAGKSTLDPHAGGSVNAINDDTSATGPIEAIAADEASLPHSDSVEPTFLQPTAGEALSFEAILNGQVPAPNPNPGLGWPPDNRLYAMARLILQDRNGEYLCSVGKQVEKGSLSCDHSPAAPLLGSSPLSPDPEPSSAPLRNEPPPKVTGPLVRDGLSPRLVGLVGQNRLSRPQRDLPTNATAVSSREQSPFPVTDTSSLSDEPVSSHLKYPPPGRLLPATPQNRRPASFPACSGHCCLERDLGRMTLGYWSQNWRTEYEWYMSRMLGRPSCGRSEGRTTGWDSWVTS